MGYAWGLASDGFRKSRSCWGVENKKSHGLKADGEYTRRGEMMAGELEKSAKKDFGERATKH